MVTRKDCVVGAVVGYLVLITIFISYRDKKSFNIDCHWDNGCIRFCCQNQSTCNEKFIRANFNSSHNSMMSSEFAYRIMYGEPSCSKRLIDDGENWTVFNDGDISVGKRWIDHEKYCFKDSTINGSVSYSLLVCDSKENLRNIMSIIVITVTSLLMALTITGFVAFGELRATASGKIEFCLLLSLIVLSASLAILQLAATRILAATTYVLIALSFVFSVSWMALLNFDVWWVTWRVKETTDGADRFKFYCFYVCGSVGLLVLWGLAEYFFFDYSIKVSTTAIYGIMLLWNGFLEVILTLATAINLFRLSRSTNFNDHGWFEIQKSRFWVNVQILIILVIVIFVKLNSYGDFFTPDSILVGDLLVCYSNILVFLIFATRKETQRMFFDSYRQLRST